MLSRLLIAFFLIFSALTYAWWSRRSIEGKFTGQSDESVLRNIPSVSFSSLDGEEVPASYIKDLAAKGFMVHFWATWCGPCESELPELLRFVNRQTADLAVILVAVNDDPLKVRRFIKQLPPVENRKVLWLMDNNQIHRKNFGTAKVPESYIFHANGSILRKLVGPQEWEKPLFFDMLKHLNP